MNCGFRIERRVAAGGPPGSPPPRACAGRLDIPNRLEPAAPNEPNSRQAGWPPGLDSAKQTQSGPAGPAPAGRLCETDPIRPRGTGILPVDPNHGRDEHATICRCGDRRSREGGLCQTKPISGLVQNRVARPHWSARIGPEQPFRRIETLRLAVRLHPKMRYAKPHATQQGYVFGTWHVAGWIFCPKTRVLAADFRPGDGTRCSFCFIHLPAVATLGVSVCTFMFVVGVD